MIGDRNYEKIYLVGKEKIILRLKKKLIPEDPMNMLLKAYIYARVKNIEVSHPDIHESWKKAFLDLADSRPYFVVSQTSEETGPSPGALPGGGIGGMP